MGTLSTTDDDVGDSAAYSFVDTATYPDNNLFAFSGSTLRTGVSFDHEQEATRTIRVRTTDAGSASYDEVFEITINDVNDSPTDISLTSNSVAENSGINAEVGDFGASDQDVGDSATFSLETGLDDTDNDSFWIDGNTLKTSFDPDVETQETYSIRVRITDSEDAWHEEAFTIVVSGENEGPTHLTLSANEIAENSDGLIGQLTTEDPDAGDTATYTLVSGQGDVHNASFEIVGGDELHAATTFDFETQPTRTVRIRTTDGGDLYHEDWFSISVTDVNEAPTQIGLSESSVAESVDVNTVVGTLSTTDPDAGDTHTYSLPAGQEDNDSFNISETSLRTTDVFDFESGTTSYTVLVRVTDQEGTGETFEETFTINITDVNDAPTDIELSNNNVAENADVNTWVGGFSTHDPDVGDAHIYSIPVGQEDNVYFARTGTGNSLRTADVFDFESGTTSYTILVRTTDLGGTGESYEETFTINVTDVNEAPTGIALSANSVAENADPNTVVGTLSSTDPDTGDLHNYSLPAGQQDNASFNISGTSLRTTDVFDFESGTTSYTVLVRVTDQEGTGETFEETFTITITDVNDAPTDIELHGDSFAENTVMNTSIAWFSTVDQDVGDTHIYSLPIGQEDNAYFRIGTGLQTADVFDFESGTTSYTIRVRTTDLGGTGESFEETFTINVTDVNEAPSFTSVGGNLVTRDDLYEYNITTTDPDADDVLTITGTTVPGWLTLTDYGNGTAQLSGTPGDEDIGYPNVVLQVEDEGVLIATQEYEIRVITGEFYCFPTDGDDDNDGLSADQAFETIGWAVENAEDRPGADTINLSEGTFNISYYVGLRTDVSLVGAGPTTIVDSGEEDRVFITFSSATVALSHFTIQNGRSSSSGGCISNNEATLTLDHMLIQNCTSSGIGGGIYNYDGSLTVRDSTITNCQAGDDLDSMGGGIYSTGSVTIERTVFDSNRAGYGGAIDQYDSTGLLTIVDSTFTGNHAAGNGGALSARGTKTITGTTFSGNTADSHCAAFCLSDDTTMSNCTIDSETDGLFQGSAVRNYGEATFTHVTLVESSDTDAFLNSGHITFINTLIVNNGTGDTCGGFGTYSYDGSNLENKDDCGFDLQNATADLGALGDNGGETETMALGAHSDAIDAVDEADCPLATDQRGNTRPVDADGDETARCDIGAYERRGPIYVEPDLGDYTGHTGLSPDDPLRTINEALDLAETLWSGDWLVLLEGTYLVSEEAYPISIETDVFFVGRGNTSVIDGEETARVLVVGDGTTVSMTGLILMDGSGGPGGCVLNYGNLTLQDVVVEGCQSSGPGGAIDNYRSSSVLNLTDVTISNSTASGTSSDYGGAIANYGTLVGQRLVLTNNSADRGGGIFISSNGDMTLDESTIASNHSLVNGGGGLFRARYGEYHRYDVHWKHQRCG